MAQGLVRRLAVLAAAIAALCVSLALFVPSASASPYCGGQTLSNYNYCYGAARTLNGDSGYGTEHSVCVGIGAISGHCSSGPGAIATFNWGSSIYIEPWIEDNAAGSTRVYGETF